MTSQAWPTAIELIWQLYFTAEIKEKVTFTSSPKTRSNQVEQAIDKSSQWNGQYHVIVYSPTNSLGARSTLYIDAKKKPQQQCLPRATLWGRSTSHSLRSIWLINSKLRKLQDGLLAMLFAHFTAIVNTLLPVKDSVKSYSIHAYDITDKNTLWFILKSQTTDLFQVSSSTFQQILALNSSLDFTYVICTL